jgi:integrase/recombinase XerD
MQLMLNAGLRCGEVLALKTSDVDWQNGQLIVRQGKGGKDRALWLNEHVLADLRLWKGRRPALENPLLFTTLKGTPIYPCAVRTMVKRRAAKAEIPKDVHPHTLRHTYATELYRACRNLLTVQKALGHSHINSTLIYTHLVDEDYEAALRNLEVGFRVSVS